MTISQSRFLPCAGKTIHVNTWGTNTNPPVVIWHGVTGTADDHRELAEKLARDYFVICPDAIGCGLSDWPSNSEEPSLEFHVKVVDDLLRQLDIKTTRWIGTSKGGGLGILYAATGTACSITQLVLHDVGPELPERFRTAVTRLIAEPPRFPTFGEFQNYLRKSLSRGGLHLTDEQWQELALRWHRRGDDGSFTYHYSPGLADQFTHHPQNFDLWEAYEQVHADTLLIRGEHSNVLPPKDAERMANCGPKCRIHTRAGGHIAFLSTAEEQQIILDFFAS